MKGPLARAKEHYCFAAPWALQSKAKLQRAEH